jgi:ATP-dependent DNA helicase RecQ
VPPYVVFHDNTLRELARWRPSTESGLRRIYGIGARKADDLGPGVLHVIRAYCAEHGLSQDVR